MMGEMLPTDLGSVRVICRPVLTLGLIVPGGNATIDSPIVTPIETVCPIRKEQYGTFREWLLLPRDDKTSLHPFPTQNGNRKS